MTGEAALLDAYRASSKYGGAKDAGRLAVDPDPDVILTNVTIFHPQLRDLLQPAGEKGKVLFVDRLNISCADFNTLKTPSTCYTLDFAAVCLTTGYGFVATGGEQSELDIRPLLPVREGSSSAEPSRMSRSPLNIAGSSREGRATSLLDQYVDMAGTAPIAGPSDARTVASQGYASSRAALHWHLRTPTGGSINNNIFIQPDSEFPRRAAFASRLRDDSRGRTSSAGESDDARHRVKRRRDSAASFTIDAADSSEPYQDHVMSEVAEKRARASHVHTDPHGRLGWSPGKDGAVPRPYATGRDAPEGSKPRSVRLLVSNNDQTVRVLKLRPPSEPRKRGAAQGDGEDGLEAGMPGLSRAHVVKLPTSINHTSYSPDGKHVVSVGDTPDVFLFRVDALTGDLVMIATYNASSDASFSTSWSPDSLQFAVASQDGIISVWDVRSSSKIAELQTTRRAYHLRPEAARVVKWSPRGDYLAFSEDTCYIHIVETTTFNIVQHIRVPSVAQARQAGIGATSNLSEASGVQCLREQPFQRQLYAELEEARVSAQINSLTTGSAPASTGPFARDSARELANEGTATTVSGTEEYDWLESTSPARFATGARTAAASASTSTLRPWAHGRRYRDIGSTSNPSTTRSTMMERALLGDWSSNARYHLRDIAMGERHVTPAHRISPSSGSETPTAAPVAEFPPPSTATDDALNRSPMTTDLDRLASGRHSSVEAFLADLTEATERSAAVWSASASVNPPPLGRRLGALGGDMDVDISGLTWEPDGESLYVSTDKLILRYKVRDLCMSFGSASLR